MKKVVLSGVQPTSSLTLGNWLGAIKNWVPLLDSHDCLFSIVNQHAITSPQDPKELREATYRVGASYIACGIDPAKAPIFVQSHVPEHTELAWILGCNTWMGELDRMTQFKDKSRKQDDESQRKKMIGAGIYFYPVLMAADILLYDANLVPVGHDQKQHIELARDIAIRMNNFTRSDLAKMIAGQETKKALFTIPEPMIPPVGAKIMSLQDPEAKMSKSDPIPNATVFLTDSNDDIVKKFKKAVTDSGTTIEYSDEKPGVKNLLSIQAAILGKKPEEIAKSYDGKMYGHLKGETAEIVANAVAPIREEVTKLMADKVELDKIFKAAAEKARARASKKMRQVNEALGLI